MKTLKESNTLESVKRWEAKALETLREKVTASAERVKVRGMVVEVGFSSGYVRPYDFTDALCELCGFYPEVYASYEDRSNGLHVLEFAPLGS